MRKNLYLCDKVHRDTSIMEYTIIIEQNPETGMYVGQCLQVPAAISQGNTCEELMDNMKDAIDLVLSYYRDEFIAENKGKNVIYQNLNWHETVF